MLSLTYSKTFTKVLEEPNGSCDKRRQVQRSLHIPRRDGSWILFGGACSEQEGGKDQGWTCSIPQGMRAVRRERISRRGKQRQQGRMDQDQLLLTSRSQGPESSPQALTTLSLTKEYADKEKHKSKSRGQRALRTLQKGLDRENKLSQTLQRV